MHGGLLRVAALAGLAIMLAGCAGPQSLESGLPVEAGQTLTLEIPDQNPLQCVPYARDHSGVKLYGDAWTWWGQAAGKFPRLAQPEAGTVMVLAGYAGPQSGHVAVVRRLISTREIRVDHANWLDDGSVYLNNPVMDVSDANDWSQVRIFNIKSGTWGGKIYPVQGFIAPNDASVPQTPESPDQDAADSRIARADPGERQ